MSSAALDTPCVNVVGLPEENSPMSVHQLTQKLATNAATRESWRVYMPPTKPADAMKVDDLVDLDAVRLDTIIASAARSPRGRIFQRCGLWRGRWTRWMIWTRRRKRSSRRRYYPIPTLIAPPLVFCTHNKRFSPISVCIVCMSDERMLQMAPLYD
jgi:hypothetical protein